jgi:pantoate--beta-alanine ligase
VECLTEPAEVRRWGQLRRCAGSTVGFVPTMGALHEGHLSLVRAARDACDAVVASVFVNPWQFGPGEDYQAYPRDLDADAAHLAEAGIDLLFAPAPEQLTPADATTTVSVGGLAQHLEGPSRPGHFAGVATIVTKLLAVVGPDRAWFGEKDFQQLAVIRRLVADLALGVAVEAGPTVREADGLAMSSRNAYLTGLQRRQALALSAALFAVAEAWDGDADWARDELTRRLTGAPGLSLDYAEVCDERTLERLTGHVSGRARALAAVRVGEDNAPTRLIDNVALPARGDG